MKPKLEQLSYRVDNQSFLCYEVAVASFEFLWHYHPEYELTYISKGKGKRLVGDSFETFEAGDLVLIGPMIPHTWNSDKMAKENCRAIVIQFSQDFITQLLQFPEMVAFEKLFTKAGRGLHFNATKKTNCIQILEKMQKSTVLTGFTLMLQLLQELSIKKALPLTSVHYKQMKGNENQQRINKVFLYVQKEFKEHISLKKAASIIHLSESAFCKFFKRASGKTFSTYVNDIRIAYASQLLIESDKAIGEIAFESGFESLTYFNRVFLKTKGVKPRELRTSAM
jgi:YesN/AraC family two-component response regulator